MGAKVGRPPLRINAWAEHLDNKHQIRDEGTVDYVLSPHGFVTPMCRLFIDTQ